MDYKYGHFGKKAGSFTITKLPRVGSYEYFLKNESLLLKLDQFGIQKLQLDAPGGIGLIKRETRETFSPLRTNFDFGKGVKNSFDVFGADSIKIDFEPTQATYTLQFGNVTVSTQLLLCSDSARLVVNTTFTNNGKDTLQLKLLPIAFTYMSEIIMAPWDKPEWYTSADYANDTFVATHYSVDGKVQDRRYLSCIFDNKLDSCEVSAERLLDQTNNFTVIPSQLHQGDISAVYGYEQCFAGLYSVSLAPNGSYTQKQVFAVSNSKDSLPNDIEQSKKYFDDTQVENELKLLQQKFDKLFNVCTVNTPDDNFNSFVNGFLPLALNWVSVLDRGWPTGMRGVRDASNDFQGFIHYDPKLCRSIITNIFSKQRSDGWYPRQVPFNGSDKFDLRHYVDSACFFSEYVYDYIAYTDDYSVLTDNYGYYDSDLVESGLTHFTKGLEYLMQPENLGEHNLVKMQGGDWLDCLRGVGVLGRGESVMVSCQLIMCLGNLVEILTKLNGSADGKYVAFAQQMAQDINKYSFNDKGFYDAVFTDKGNWIFSKCDEDGKSRVYVPTNAYAIISGVAKDNQRQVLENIKKLRTKHGYKLFDTPLGATQIDGIGKMGSGDFQPYFAENGSVYNHGAQCFLIRALATMGEKDLITDVLKCALPFYDDVHPQDAICSAPYALTNCYQLIPSFEGRTMFSFLTGSSAMLFRAIYYWIFGVTFGLNTISFKPCTSAQFANSTVCFNYNGKRITVNYVGSGTVITSASVNGTAVDVTNGLVIDKKDITTDCTIEINLK